MAWTRTDTGSNLGLMLAMDENIFTHASVSNFTMSNIINMKPICDLSVIDTQSSFVRERSLGFLSIYLTNTTDDVTEKSSRLAGIIDDIENEKQVSGNSVQRIKWSAGTESQLINNTKAWNGSSSEVLGKIFEERNTSVNNMTTGNIDATDNMWWRFPQDTMWESLESCVKHSYIRDDYLFWAWDDVNDNYKVSSFNLEMAQSDRYILVESESAKTSTAAGLALLDNPKVSVWSFDNRIKRNELGKNRDKLFPNLHFAGTREGEYKDASIQKGCFSEVLADMGDMSQQTIAQATDIKDPLTTFGPRIVKRHWPNNTHKYYSLAEMYREYKLATYGKVIYVQLYNQVGPPIGSKVTVLTAGNDYKTRGFSLDRFASDKYILVEKYFDWGTEKPNRILKTSPVSSEWVTTLKLVSNNITDGDPDHIASLLKSLGATA